ncbi:MAG: transcription-repair coupling factor [Elusimicrobiota bacterium]
MDKIFADIPNPAAAGHYLFSKNLHGKDYIFAVFQDEQEAQDAYCEIKEFKKIFFEKKSGLPVLFLSGKDEKLKSAAQIHSSRDPKIIIMSVKSLSDEIPSQDSLEENSLYFKTGQKITRTQLAEIFLRFGYERTSFVEKEGDFALRGAVADFFCPGKEYPERIFLSDKIEQIKTFDISSQQTLSFLKETKIFSRNISGDKITKLKGSKILIDFSGKDIKEDLSDFDAYVSIFPKEGFKQESKEYERNLKFNHDKFLIKKETERLSSEKFSIFFSCSNQREAQSLEDFIKSEKITSGKILYSSLERGFISQKEKFALITFKELFSRYEFSRTRNFFGKNKSFKFSDLSKGDYLVHEDFGIGRYLGIRKISDTSPKGEIRETECLEIEYAKGDKLLVPLYEFKRVQKYIGSQGKAPKLSHMDTKTWGEIKNRVKKEIESIAKELLILEAKRAASKTKPFPPCLEEKDFENAFPYEETPDQKKAIFETLSDLEKTSPMNRVIVGDVGFGKTEVAMRAAFRAALNGAQVCVLCPTTILAEQHYRNFLKRFDGFPVKIRVLSRLTKTSDAKKTLLEAASGEADILIGTHKLLQKKMKFKNLGLLIIDEEHKFGVKDKEKLKASFSGLHCLTLSATPIPRTLYQSLSSLRTMSVIESPPFGRLPVYTKTGPYDEEEIKKAVYEELNRNGQIYYVYNKVETIESKKAKLSKLLPAARIAHIHGQMPSSKIEDVMDDFLEKKYDILLASTIIESGIDIPSVNTLIIENAHALGLAQLYQLRGRIGREKQKAYCYLFYPPFLGSDALSCEAAKRLAALSEFSELGSGFRLAMRDLEIRGAGELLGPKQHGFLNSIGLDMYIKLLNGEIAKLKGKEIKETGETLVEIDLPAYIPQDYIQDEMERLNYYKKLLNSDINSIDSVLNQLKDISGEIPEPLSNLTEIIKLRKKLAEKKIRSVSQRGDILEVFYEKSASVKIEQIMYWQKEFPDIRFFKTTSGDGFSLPLKKDVLSVLNSLFFNNK